MPLFFPHDTQTQDQQTHTTAETDKPAFQAISDQQTDDSINADKDLDKTKLEYVLGQHRIEDFENADCVIKNPGVKIQGNKYLA